MTRARVKTRTEALRLEEHLCFALYAASRAIIRAYQPLLGPLGLTYPQYLALLVLWEHDGLSVKQLGGRLGLDSATLTPLLKRLERQGFVERRRDRDDERVLHLHLTAEGRALRRHARGIAEKLACRAGFDPAEPHALAQLAELRDTLHALTRRLDAAQ